jgi:transcriptional regulator
MSLRDILETTNRGVRTTETGARSNIEDAKNSEQFGKAN